MLAKEKAIIYKFFKLGIFPTSGAREVSSFENSDLYYSAYDNLLLNIQVSELLKVGQGRRDSSRN